MLCIRDYVKYVLISESESAVYLRRKRLGIALRAAAVLISLQPF